MDELKEVMSSAITEISTLEARIFQLETQKKFLIGEIKNFKRIFEHENMHGYKFLTESVLSIVGTTEEGA